MPVYMFIAYSARHKIHLILISVAGVKRLVALKRFNGYILLYAKYSYCGRIVLNETKILHTVLIKWRTFCARSYVLECVEMYV
jgi:hypothetical protein